MPDNDADKRPRMFGFVGEDRIELTIKGSEGETTEDIEGLFDEKLDRLTEAQNELVKDTGPTKGCE